MPEPTVGTLAEEVYEAPLSPYTHEDAALDWPLKTYVGAILDRAQEVADLARESDDGPGWSAIVDPDRAPLAWLPWLAQLVGVALPPPGSPEYSQLDEAGMRLRIKETDGQKRGTIAALRAAAQQHLTGTKTVTITERVGGNAYQIAVETLVAETPDEDIVEATLLEQKAAGLVLTYTTA